MMSSAIRTVRACLLALAAVSTLTVSLAACGGDDADTSPTPSDSGTKVEPTLSSIQANILTPSCALSGCHDAASDDPGLNLSAGATFGAIVGKPSIENSGQTLVVAGDASKSLFFNVLTSAVGKTPVMPKGLAKLSAAQKAAIEQWINDGAQDN